MERTADYRTLDRVVNTNDLNSCMNTAEAVTGRIMHKTDSDIIKENGRMHYYRLAGTGIRIYRPDRRCCTSTVSTGGAFNGLSRNETEIAKNMIKENLRSSGYTNISFRENTVTATFLY